MRIGSFSFEEDQDLPECLLAIRDGTEADWARFDWSERFRHMEGLNSVGVRFKSESERIGHGLSTLVIFKTPFSYALEIKRRDAALYMVRHGLDVNGYAGGSNHGRSTVPLKMAAGYGDEELVVELLKAGAKRDLKHSIQVGGDEFDYVEFLLRSFNPMERRMGRTIRDFDPQNPPTPGMCELL